MATIATLDMHEAKAHLDEHVAKLEPGDRIVLCDQNGPVAEILPIPAPSTAPRPVGLGKGLAQVPSSFFDPLPDDILSRFDGTAPNDAVGTT